MKAMAAASKRTRARRRLRQWAISEVKTGDRRKTVASRDGNIA
jgi:hypothetical protein